MNTMVNLNLGKAALHGLGGMNIKAMVLAMALPLAAIAGGSAYFGTPSGVQDMVDGEMVVDATASMDAARDAVAHAGSIPAPAKVVLKPLTFKEGRANADTDAMRAAVEAMARKGKIAKGMTFNDVMGVLGVPDNTTSRYVKGGYSIGYSALAPTGDNYGHFFWLHFKADPALNPNGEKVLAGWWAVK